MKKLIAAIALAATVGFIGLQEASAWRGQGGGGYGAGDCWRANQENAQQLDAETKEARDAFLAATADLRTEMSAKRAEMRELMTGDSFDEQKAGALAAEMYTLRTELQAKADETGWKGGYGARGFGGKGCNGHRGAGYGMGPGFGCDGDGPCGGKPGAYRGVQN